MAQDPRARRAEKRRRKAGMDRYWQARGDAIMDALRGLVNGNYTRTAPLGCASEWTAEPAGVTRFFPWSGTTGVAQAAVYTEVR